MLLLLKVCIFRGPSLQGAPLTRIKKTIYSDGWIGYLDYTSVYPDMGGDGGLIPYRTDWTIEDVVMDGFGCGVSRYIRMDDPWELRNAVDSGDYGYAEELISRIPGLRSTFSNMTSQSEKE